MSNLGLELALRRRGIDFERAAVGDRYVLARLRETRRHARRGNLRPHPVPGPHHHGRWPDQRLQVLAVMRADPKSLAELAAGMNRLPQVLLNVQVAERFDPLTVPSIMSLLQTIEEQLAIGAGWCCAPRAPNR